MRGYHMTVAAGVLSLCAFTAWDSSAQQCVAEQPCFTEHYQDCHTVRFAFNWGEDWDYYNIRYRKVGGGVAQIENETGTFAIPNARPSSTYTISVQGCYTRFLAPSRCSAWVEESVTTVGDFGPDTCRPGYVWREASPTDHVCVHPDDREEVRTDNALAASRRQPGVWGPNTCKAPYVWREAFSGDAVCVPVETRTRVQRQNARAAETRICR